MPEEARAADGVHVAHLETSPEAATERVAGAAEEWGGEWQFQGPTAGRLILPVSAGVRRGWIGYEVTVRPDGDGAGSVVELAPAEEHLHVDRATVVVLATSLFGALLFLIVPFVPRLLPLVPVGFVLAVAGWFFVVARLRNSGAEEFLEVLEAADGDDGDRGGGGGDEGGGE